MQPSALRQTIAPFHMSPVSEPCNFVSVNINLKCPQPAALRHRLLHKHKHLSSYSSALLEFPMLVTFLIHLVLQNLSWLNNLLYWHFEPHQLVLTGISWWWYRCLSISLLSKIQVLTRSVSEARLMRLLVRLFMRLQVLRIMQSSHLNTYILQCLVLSGITNIKRISNFKKKCCGCFFTSKLNHFWM